MEFLLINHPLDCPICDQGGECELQDLAMGFGRDVSRYNEGKRVVKDNDLGPLVSTDMTRCIHCTRCIRFTEEVAGIQELGATGRSEHMEIGTYVERSVDHELSGNIIDLCPVGALNNKPYRYRARAWEMAEQPTVAPHDCVGSNIYAHVLRGQVMRVVPRANDDINESWISDRDRFSCHGVYSNERLERPLLKVGDQWHETDWETALEAAVKGVNAAIKDNGGADLGVLISPSATVEEHYLLARLARGLGCNNIDHRLRHSDLRDQEEDPRYPSLGMAIADIDTLDGLLIIGSNVRREAPMLAHRIRKAALRGAEVMFLNATEHEYFFPVARDLSPANNLVAELAAVVGAAVAETNREVPATLQGAVHLDAVQERHQSVAEKLINNARGAVLLGHLAAHHPAYADLRALAGALADVTGSRLGYISEGGNAAGAALAGTLPHRTAGGETLAQPGLGAAEMLDEPRRAYLLFGIEPEQDCARGEEAVTTLAAADFVVSMVPYVTDRTREYANVVLPIGTFAETSGTYVNVEGRWQSVPGVAQPVGEARPGWKVLRVLGNLHGLHGFDYQGSEAVRDELRERVEVTLPDNVFRGSRVIEVNAKGPAAADVPMYRIDAVVRRSQPLQLTREGREAVAY